jgi:poly(hydroxyalkanoate) depolymerase family esterase
LFTAVPALAVEPVTGFGSNPGNLKMYQHVPANAVTPLPVVVVLHGCTQQATPYAQGTGWVALADELGFALVMPEQQSANNNNSCFNWFQDGDITRGQGEAESIHQMFTHFAGGHTVDMQRVYVTGLSAGGAMTDVLLATYPDLFSAGAIFAGVAYRCAASVTDAFGCMNNGKTQTAAQWGDLVRAASTHTGPWPRVSIWHGASDHTVVPANADAEVLQWTHVNGVSSTAATTVTQGVDTWRTYVDGSGVVRVEEHRIAGMDHGTPVDPGTGAEQCGTAGAYILDVNICSTRAAARFFGLLGGAGPSDAGVLTGDASVATPDAAVVVQDAGSVNPGGSTETFSGLSGAADGLDLSGWSLGQFSLVTEDHTGTPGSKAIQGSVVSGTPNCASGLKSTTLSRMFTLGAHPTLRYQRKLALDAAVNINSTAAFRVKVGGAVVEETSVTFMQRADVAWEAHSVDLLAHANQVVELSFVLEANSTVCIAVTAQATLDDIVVEDAVVSIVDAGGMVAVDAAVVVHDAGTVVLPDAGVVDAAGMVPDAAVVPPADAGMMPVSDGGAVEADAGSGGGSSNCDCSTSQGGYPLGLLVLLAAWWLRRR